MTTQTDQYVHRVLVQQQIAQVIDSTGEATGTVMVSLDDSTASLIHAAADIQRELERRAKGAQR